MFTGRSVESRKNTRKILNNQFVEITNKDYEKRDLVTVRINKDPKATNILRAKIRRFNLLQF